MYFIIRVFLGITALILLLYLLKKFNLNKLKIAAYVLSLALTVLSVFWPFENYFVTFDNEYDAFEYCYNPFIKDISFSAKHIDGCVVVGKTYLGGKIIAACPGTYDGFKLPSPMNYKKVASATADGLRLDVYWCKQMQMHFSVVNFSPDVHIEDISADGDTVNVITSTSHFVTDNLGNRFAYDVSGDGILPSKMYIAIVEQMPATYTVTYKDKSVSITF